MFRITAQDSGSSARCGFLKTPHGEISTPVFMPVGTQGTVKATSPQELHTLSASIILGNTYHLSVRPGMEVIEKLGGLHAFMNWSGPILTDSGGFQVYSLAKLRKISEEGVQFQNHVDGTPTFLSPERSMEIQSILGSDIAMLFDDCPPYPCERGAAEESLALTLRWAKRCKQWIDTNPSEQLHFGIVQGSIYKELRERSACTLVEIGFDGYAIGGVSVGEPEEEMFRAVDHAVPFLPEDKPRYAMGLGTPPQLLEMIARGVDLFDCVLPTRLARTGTVFTEKGTFNIRNERFKADPTPLDGDATCPACQGFSRAYIRHLIKSEEILGLRLITLHNLYFYLNLMERARRAIAEGSFKEFKETFITHYKKHESL